MNAPAKRSFGFCFHAETDPKVCAVIVDAYLTKRRVRLWYGDVNTGRSWNDEYSMIGRIGKSTGSQPIPLLIASSRSRGGAGLLDHCIIRIDDVASKRTLYTHPQFHTGVMTVVPAYSPYYVEAATIEGDIHAQFKKRGQAQRWIDFMQGKRYAK